MVAAFDIMALLRAEGLPQTADVTPLLTHRDLTVLRMTPKNAPAGGRLQVVFTSFRGSDRRDPALEFQQLPRHLGGTTLVIFDHTRSFYNVCRRYDPAIGFIGREIDRLGLADITTYGSSMGAFAAIAVARDIPVRFATAFGPRYSTDFDIVDDPRRTEPLKRSQHELVHSTLDDGLAKLGGGIILHGLRGPDHLHAPRFPKTKNVAHYVMPRAPHGVAGYLRRKGVFKDLMQAAAQENAPLAATILQQAGGMKPDDWRAYALATPLRLFYDYSGTTARRRKRWKKSQNEKLKGTTA